MTEQVTVPETEKPKLTQQVEIKDVGPCKKHIRVEVDPGAINTKLNEQFTKIVADQTTAIAGFRPGKAPRKIIERRFHKDVSEQVKAEVLLQSLEQLAEDHDVAPLSPPDLDPSKIDLPKDGPLVYEFEVEVRPQFDVPQYRGLTLKRPVREITEEDIDKTERRLLGQVGDYVEKAGPVNIGDVISADVKIADGDRVIGELTGKMFLVERQLAFKDGVAKKFGDQMKGVQAGETRTIDVELSELAADASLRSKSVKAEFAVKEVRELKLPELTEALWHQFGVHSQDQFRERIRVYLGRQLEYEQRQAAKQQVLQTITSANTWELPRDLLARQARATLNRQYMEMKSNGMSEQEIASRIRMLQQDIYNSTAQTLKEHFVLQKIAETEKIDVDEDEIADEIDRLADEADESPRRLRARLEKEDLLESLAIELIERKVLNMILESATYEDIRTDADDDRVSVVEEQAVPGKMRDLGEEAAKTESPE